MELILYIALGLVLGFFLLAFIDKVIVAGVIGVVAVIAFMVLLVAVSVFDSMSPQDAQEFGVFLLVILGLALAWDLLKLLRYLYRVARGKSRIKSAFQNVSESVNNGGEDDHNREVAASPYAANRFVLRRETTVGWVTIDGSDYQSELSGVSPFGVTAQLFFRKKHRIVEHQSHEEFVIRREKTMGRQGR